MDLQTLLIGLGVLMFAIAPIFYFQRKHRNEQNETRIHLDRLGRAQGLSFSVYEFWGSGYAIGLDTSKKVLCYVDSVANEEKPTFINLAEVEKCTVINEHRTINDNRVIEQIKLDFTLKNSRTHQSLLFYDREANLNFTNELVLAEKWKATVNARVSSGQLVA
ncbi:hypothetical protein ACSX1A_06135 [Pontibacter sp. MBLB2868]|uniref:hypothetical protein n=1 Tax=Pontibacter sp. MBLB2868 TaxID=3451555 RepID=UPI003F755497